MARKYSCRMLEIGLGSVQLYKCSLFFLSVKGEIFCESLSNILVLLWLPLLPVLVMFLVVTLLGTISAQFKPYVDRLEHLNDVSMF